MDILIVMGLGILAGKMIVPKKMKSFNEKMQVASTLLLIFTLGITLGKRENFLSELSSLGIESAIFCIVPTIFSIIVVYVLTKKFMEKR